MKNKVVIITGASSGIGKSLALVFGTAGCKLVICARNEASLKKAKQELSLKSISVTAVCADVSREDDCKLLIDTAIQTYGGIDVLINNAGISMRALFEDVSVDVIRQLMNVNFWGTVYCSKFALPYLIKSKGSVVGISSIAGKVGLPGRTGYSASKFAMEGFLSALRTENLKKGLHVLVACPGFTASNIRNTALSKTGTSQGESPLDEKQLMQPEAVAERIYQAVLSRKRDLVLTSSGKLTVILNKFFPAFLDRLVFKKMSSERDSPFK